MELKRYNKLQSDNQCILLIVPYGIETLWKREQSFSRTTLLIVPYGIETNLQRHSGS